MSEMAEHQLMLTFESERAKNLFLAMLTEKYDCRDLPDARVITLPEPKP
jgi:hypothetical protein